jgi:hypothetical protein
MLGENYQQVSGVILNKCQGHGTWLDHGNTTRLTGMTGVPGSGFGRARRLARALFDIFS